MLLNITSHLKYYEECVKMKQGKFSFIFNVQPPHLSGAVTENAGKTVLAYLKYDAEGMSQPDPAFTLASLRQQATVHFLCKCTTWSWDSDHSSRVTFQQTSQFYANAWLRCIPLTNPMIHPMSGVSRNLYSYIEMV